MGKTGRFLKKYKFLWIAPILVALVLAFFLFGNSASETGNALKDCGNNSYCFEVFAQECKPVRQTDAFSIAFGKVFLFEEVRGFEGNNCVFYYKITKTEIIEPGSFGNSSERELFNKYKQKMELLEGKDMLCLIPKEAMGGPGVFSPTNPEVECSGPLVEELWKK